VPLTARQLNRATLARQLLLRREPFDPVAGLSRIVALQAQEPASAYVALWDRLADFDARALDDAFKNHEIVKAQLMRITLHAVTAADYPAFHEAMQPTLRAARLNDRRFTGEKVPIDVVDALVPDLLAFTAEPRRNADVEPWLEARFGVPKPRVWWALRQYGPFVHATTGRPWSFGPRPSYLGARQQERPRDTAASVQRLVRRYLEGFGPATMQDIAQFGTIYRPPVQNALDSLNEELDRFEGPGNAVLYDVPGGTVPDEDVPAPPRLLPMWDSALLAYADRSRTIPPAYRKLVMRNNGDVLPTLLVDGFVAGVWRTTADGIEAAAFHPLTGTDWAGLEAEATALRRFLVDREPMIYGRYAHWWEGLPGSEVRVLGR
jgi:winged helix DNA-binding protein